MRSLSYLGAAVALALVSAPASANVVFDLSDVTLQGGGEMIGSITLSDSLNTVVALNITVPAAVIGGFPFSQITYTAADTVSSQLPFNFIRVDDSLGDEMQLAFTQITALGVASFFTGGQSYDHQPSGGNRLVTGGSLVPYVASATPLPATWTMMLFGLAGLGFVAYWGTKKSAAALAAT